ncbi:Y-family DNA polymerase [Henriciella aquimarina]|uniref:Y-family DNA polymerase n=1 Tax=Henriciella aquimarina TaxID=545261 RepID=UPI0009FEB28D|nr:DNA polymerase Y family protein [Henriciella aquimarina]
MRRTLSLWLPQLPLDRRIRLGDGRAAGPFAIVAEIRNAWRLTHLSQDAVRAGLSPGLSLPDARAICPALLTEPADPAREDALLRALWRWADRFSPLVSLDPPDGLLLDITGCAHLFGGEAAMGETIRERAGDLQITARIGIADTKSAAVALARFSSVSVAIAETGRTADVLAGLPLAALGLEPGLLHDIRRTGLKTVGQLYGVKTAELARRFGLDLTSALERSLGRTPDPVVPKRAGPVYAARATLPDPIGLMDDLEAVIMRLADSVCGRLEAAQCGARRYRLTVRPVDARDEIMTIGFAKPTAAPDAVLQQFRTPLDKLSLAFGADFFRLAAESVEPLHPRQAGFDRQTEREDDRAALISTLGNRLGFDRVRLFAPADSHLPECEFTTIEAVDCRKPPVWTSAPRLRPLRLYHPPEPVRVETAGRPPLKFEWRRAFYEMASASGPERLAGEWWRDEAGPLRDYWRVETRAGARLWLMTWPGQGGDAWYVAGRFP